LFSEGVVGSSTVCVATLDQKLGQLSYSNVGDCGLMVLRHIDSGRDDDDDDDEVR